MKAWPNEGHLIVATAEAEGERNSVEADPQQGGPTLKTRRRFVEAELKMDIADGSESVWQLDARQRSPWLHPRREVPGEAAASAGLTGEM